MDPETKKYYRNIALIALGLAMCTGYLAWALFETCIVRKDPISLITDSRWKLFIIFSVLSVILISGGYDEYAKRNGFKPGSPGIQNLPADGGDLTVVQRTGLSRFIPESVLTYGLALVSSVILIGLTYGYFLSLPLTLIMTGVLFVCYIIVRQMIPTADWGVGFAAIVICVGFPIALFGNVIPGLTPHGLLQQILVQSVPFIYVVLLLVLLIYMWISDNGIPFISPLTEKDLQEPCEKELVVSLPYDRAFEHCREAIRLLPNNRIDNDEPSFGLLEGSASPGWGRSTKIHMSTEEISNGKTRVKIRCISPDPPADNKPWKRTYMNEKYMQILASYIQSRL